MTTSWLSATAASFACFSCRAQRRTQTCAAGRGIVSSLLDKSCIPEALTDHHQTTCSWMSRTNSKREQQRTSNDGRPRFKTFPTTSCQFLLLSRLQNPDFLSSTKHFSFFSNSSLFSRFLWSSLLAVRHPFHFPDNHSSCNAILRFPPSNPFAPRASGILARDGVEG